jgi:hypothetical protein
MFMTTVDHSIKYKIDFNLKRLASVCLPVALTSGGKVVVEGVIMKNINLSLVIVVNNWRRNLQ